MEKIEIAVVLGPRGSFSDRAAAFLKIKARYTASFAEIFRSVAKAGLGIVPVRNKIIGEIKSTMRFFKRSSRSGVDKFKILKRFKMPVSFILAARPGRKTELENIKFIYCAKIANQQCKKYIVNLKKTNPAIKIITNFPSTSSAFKKIVQQKGGRAGESAAIGSQYAAKIYGLKILAKQIQDSKADWTEFVLFSASAPSAE